MKSLSAEKLKVLYSVMDTNILQKRLVLLARYSGFLRHLELASRDVAKIQYRHLFPAPVDRTSVSVRSTKTPG